MDLQHPGDNGSYSGPAYAQHVRVARKRAQQRWSALLTRIGKINGMAARLGAAHWENFADFVRGVFMRDFLELFDPVGGVLRCAGPLDGDGACPNAMRVDRGPDGQRGRTGFALRPPPGPHHRGAAHLRHVEGGAAARAAVLGRRDPGYRAGALAVRHAAAGAAPAEHRAPLRLGQGTRAR